MATASCVIIAILGTALQATAPSLGATKKLADYVTREWPGESHQQAITSTALTLLADAIEAAAVRELPDRRDVAEHVVGLRHRIDEYRLGPPGNLEQSRRLRRILIDASSLIERLLESADARRSPRDPRLNALERSARSLSDNAPVSRQPDVLERFFRHAVEALDRLERPRG